MRQRHAFGKVERLEKFQDFAASHLAYRMGEAVQKFPAITATIDYRIPSCTRLADWMRWDRRNSNHVSEKENYSAIEQPTFSDSESIPHILKIISRRHSDAAFAEFLLISCFLFSAHRIKDASVKNKKDSKLIGTISSKLTHFVANQGSAEMEIVGF
jgi:hypothetical protein